MTILATAEQFQPSTSGGRMLIVDADQAQLHTLCEVLERAGCVARGFDSPREALAETRRGEYDLLVTSPMVPATDGIDLIAAVRQVDPQIGVIVLADQGTSDAAAQAMRGGALACLRMPLWPDVALQVVARALELQRLRRQIAVLPDRERHQAAELAAARRDLDALSYSISHDLRAPLLFVKDFAQRLEEEHAALLGEDARGIVRLIRDGSRSVDDMVVGLLAFSRAVREPIERAPLEMEPVVHAALDEARRTYGGPEPLIELGALPPAFADPGAIRLVWLNLISNALKFSASREQPRIRISARVEGGEVVYSVEDNGVGFDMRYADKLFSLFKRLHSAEEFPGAGVGLAIAHRIVARHGGRMWAESSPGAGTTLRFSLCAATAII